jgi:hypothetical protein
MFTSTYEVEKNDLPMFLKHSNEKVLLQTKEETQIYQVTHPTFDDFVKDYFQAKHQCVNFTPPKNIFIKKLEHPLFYILEERFKDSKELEDLEKVSFRFLDYFDFVLDSGNTEVQDKYLKKIKNIEISLESFSKSNIHNFHDKYHILDLKTPGKLFVTIFRNDDYEFEVRALGEPEKIKNLIETLANEIIEKEEEDNSDDDEEEDEADTDEDFQLPN